MNKFQKFCITSLKIIIGIALFFIFFRAKEKIEWNNNDTFSYKLAILILPSIIIGAFIILSKLSTKIKIVSLLILALLIRIWWVLNINSIPVSDFNEMYLAAKELLNGNNEAFRNYNYLSRFPHLVCTTLYMAVIIFIFPTANLIVMKIINIFLSTLSIFLLYKLAENFIKHERIRLCIILISAVFPPFVSYVSTYCTENIAIPLYLFTMIMFFNAIKDNSSGKWILVGLLLTLSNLFRGVGPIFLIAFLIYIFIFTKERKIKNASLLIVGLVTTSIFISLFLISINITNKPLWQGDEPSFATLLLKGTNIENEGRWNLEDATFVENNLKNPDLTRKCIEISINRINSLTFIEKFNFFKNKFLTQWSAGDFSGSFWAFLETGITSTWLIPPVFQLLFVIIIFLSFISLFINKSDKNTVLLYILLCGFGLLFMLIETQSRYSYIISWTFIILAVQGIENTINILRGVKNVKKIRTTNTKI